LNFTVEKVHTALGTGKAKLLAVRDTKPKPHLDDKILAAWNGLFIRALAKAYQVLEDEKYLAAANRALKFIKVCNLIVGVHVLVIIPSPTDSNVQARRESFDSEFQRGPVEHSWLCGRLCLRHFGAFGNVSSWI